MSAVLNDYKIITISKVRRFEHMPTKVVKVGVGVGIKNTSVPNIIRMNKNKKNLVEDMKYLVLS